jgi:hypothetical protein
MVMVFALPRFGDSSSPRDPAGVWAATWRDSLPCYVLLAGRVFKSSHGLILAIHAGEVEAAI